MSVRIGRRLFLQGSGGLVALPLLEALLPARAHAATAPKRFILMTHHHGRLIGNGKVSNGVMQDAWSPLTATGALPAAMSPLLAPLAAIRDEVVTLDRVDNLVRHLATGTGANDGHQWAIDTYLTQRPPVADGKLGGPSIDHIVGERLRASTAMPASMMIDMNSGNGAFIEGFAGANATAPNCLNPNGSPRTAVTRLFQNVQPGGAPPQTPSARDRLVKARGAVLGGVAEDFAAVRGKVGATDKARLDQHLDFLSDTRARLGVTQPTMTPAACQPMAASDVPAIVEQYSYSSAHDDVAAPVLIDAVVRALVCDVSRSIALNFASDVPTFDWLYPGGTPFSSEVWHAQIHSSGGLSGAAPTNVKPTAVWYAQMFTQLVQKLAATTDVDGQRMLDNTLVLWVSDLGYGSSHGCFNVPVVMAGLKSAFSKGQGRHVVPAQRASLADVYAQVLRMFGGGDMTFGVTGTLASVAGTRAQSCDGGTTWCSDYGFPGHVGPDTPLHLGPLDL